MPGVQRRAGRCRAGRAGRATACGTHQKVLERRVESPSDEKKVEALGSPPNEAGHVHVRAKPFTKARRLQGCARGRLGASCGRAEVAPSLFLPWRVVLECTSRAASVDEPMRLRAVSHRWRCRWRCRWRRRRRGARDDALATVRVAIPRSRLGSVEAGGETAARHVTRRPACEGRAGGVGTHTGR